MPTPPLWPLLALPLLVGCSRGPARIDAPAWEPDAITARAFELLDVDGNGVLDERELDAAPGLKSALWHLDEDGDQGISNAELRERFMLYQQLGTGLIALPVRITYRGQPLPGAQVRFIPEDFLEGVIEPAAGTTDRDGLVTPTTRGFEDFPGLRIGFYRVEVESPHLKKAKAIEAAASLGLEASPVSDGNRSTGTPELAIRD